MDQQRNKACGLWLVVTLAVLAGCVTDDVGRSESEEAGWPGVRSDARNTQAVADGRRIAQRECAMCHAIDKTSVSPDAGAPPFRDLAFLNDPDWVAYRLIDGIRMGHQNMPLFDFDVRSADALMAYISTLND